VSGFNELLDKLDDETRHVDVGSLSQEDLNREHGPAADPFEVIASTERRIGRARSSKSSSRGTRATRTNPHGKQDEGALRSSLVRAIEDLLGTLDKGAGASLVNLGTSLRNTDPQWRNNIRSLGYDKLSTFLDSAHDFEIFGKHPRLFVRRRR
jgi:OST-HTH/LOTUS domain